jgi:hypothetical protein
MGIIEWLEGKKTFIGGFGFMLWGISDLFIGYYEGTPVDFNITVGKILAGWVIIGGRSAANK